MRALRFTLDDVAYLTGPGREALVEVAARPLTDASRVADIGWARSRFGDRAAVLVQAPPPRSYCTRQGDVGLAKGLA